MSLVTMAVKFFWLGIKASDFYLYLKHLSQRNIINNLPSKSLIITKRNKDLLRKQKMVWILCNSNSN